VHVLKLILKNALRHRLRTGLTVAGIVVAILSFGLLQTVVGAWYAGANAASDARLVTRNAISLAFTLPLSYASRIRAVEGVSAVSHANWFGGVYQEPKNFFPNEAVADNFLDLYPEWIMPEEQRKAFKATRTGAIVGQSLADRFHWKLGDKIPLQATIFAKKDGSNTWIFDLVGIYHVRDEKLKSQENALFFNWDYFNEAAQFGGNSTVGWYAEKLADRGQADAVAQAVDRLSADSEHETKTQSEQSFTTALVSQFANIGLIVGAIMAAVFFTLVLLTGNTMAQAVRERVPELAVLKTIGFSNQSVLGLVLAESVLLLLLGGSIGVAVSGVVVNVVRARLGDQLPLAPLDASIWLSGLALMVLIGLVVGALPAVRGMRLRIVDALSGR
jgi:putative ABC transport system permease protein